MIGLLVVFAQSLRAQIEEFTMRGWMTRKDSERNLIYRNTIVEAIESRGNKCRNCGRMKNICYCTIATRRGWIEFRNSEGDPRIETAKDNWRVLIEGTTNRNIDELLILTDVDQAVMMLYLWANRSYHHARLLTKLIAMEDMMHLGAWQANDHVYIRCNPLTRGMYVGETRAV